MTYDEKCRLALTGRFDNEAAARRVLAARKSLNMSQSQLGDEIGRSDTTIIAIEKGRQLPSWPLMMWFFNNHRIDMNFLVAGNFSQLPSDVQDALFECLRHKVKKED